jgi:hypothetical protein
MTGGRWRRAGVGDRSKGGRLPCRELQGSRLAQRLLLGKPSRSERARRSRSSAHTPEHAKEDHMRDLDTNEMTLIEGGGDFCPIKLPGPLEDWLLCW